MPLSRVDAVFCFGISGIPPCTNRCLFTSFSKQFLSAVIFGTSPVHKPFLIYILSVFIGCSLGSSFRYLPASNLTLLILVSSNFDWVKYLGTFSRLRTNGKYIYGWVILKRQRREERRQKQRRKKTRKKGGEKTSEKCEELEGKGQALLKGRGTIGCYKSGVGDCQRATAYVLLELCC